MTRWRTSALLGASAAALLIVSVPFGNGAMHEFGVLKRIAEERVALLKAAGLPTDALPQVLVPRGWEASADGLSASEDRPVDASSIASFDIPIPPEAPAAAPETPAPEPAQPQAIPGQAATPAAVPASPAALAYGKGDAAALTALANAAHDPDERLALEWAALRTDPHPPEAALVAFAKAHPKWLGNGYIHSRQEADLVIHPLSPAAVLDYFAAVPPQSSAGALALARAKADLGHVDEAIGAVRELWRDGTFDSWTEGLILREFGGSLLKADHKARADRLLYAETYGPALRAAALAGADEMALAEARIAAARGPLSPALVKAVPAALKDDPGLPLRPDPGRTPLRPGLRGRDAARPRADGPHGSHQPR